MKHFLFLPLITLFLPVVAFGFEDVKGSSVEEYLSQAIEIGIINSENKYFRPSNYINRAEIAKILIEYQDIQSITFSTSEAQRIPFVDVNNENWFYSYVKSSVERGIFKGYEDKTFKPSNSITKGEAAKVIVKTLNIPEYKGLIPYQDVEEDDWFYPFIKSLYRFCAIDNNKLFYPHENITRSEFVEIFIRALNKECDTAEILDGEIIYYYENGEIKDIVNYQDGVQNGLHIRYNGDGVKIAEANYLNGQRHGLTSLYNEDGIKGLEQNYLNGKVNGESIYFNEDGSISHIQEYVNDIKHGKHTRFFPSGLKSSESVYINGVETGLYIIWQENGQSIEIELVDGVMQGLFTSYDEDGLKEVEYNYSNDMKNGKVTYFYSSGAINITGSFSNDKRNGEWKLFDKIGILEAIIYYQNGEIINFIEY